MGNIGAATVSTTPGLLIGRRLRITGSGSGTFEDLRQSLALLVSGAVKPVIAEQMRFSEAARAHALLDEKAIAGRVVMRDW
jgi:D-arabinose 1-dehydrogenase-like Zn-dependent alcohol dehydrogenase